MNPAAGAFQHEACIYENDSQFLHTALPFLSDGLALGEPVLAVTNPANLHVVRAIVGLAHAFGLETIAEGVQDEEAMTILRQEGVDFAQGFHLGRPSPINPEKTTCSAYGLGKDERR